VAHHGLVKRPELNGKLGTVLGPDHSKEAAAAAPRGRVPDHSKDGSGTMLLKPSCLDIRLCPSRFSLRLRRLPNNVLADLAATMAEMSPVSAKCLADAVLAKHDPVSNLFVHGIFQTPDIVACIFSSLDPCAQVAMVCKVWKQVCNEILEKRRFLRPAPLAEPDDNVASNDEFFMSSPPSGAWLCYTYHNRGAKILDASMSRIHSIARFPNHLVQGVAASEDRIYLSAGGNPDEASRIVAFESNGTQTGAEFVLDNVDLHGYFEDQAHELTLGNDLLFAIVLEDHRHGRIVALDVNTLEQQYSFGSSIFHNDQYCTTMRGMTVASDALYVGDSVRGCLQVFSLAGEHLHEVRGDWWAPQQVLHFNGRLYLFECDPDDGLGDYRDENDDDSDDGRASVGKRVFVLSLQGETLQVWRPQLSSYYIYNMCILGHKLILRLGEPPNHLQFVALWGL